MSLTWRHGWLFWAGFFAGLLWAYCFPPMEGRWWASVAGIVIFAIPPTIGHWVSARYAVRIVKKGAE